MNIYIRCVFYGDLYGCGGENPQKPMSQLEDFIRARKVFAYGECREWRLLGKATGGCMLTVC